MEKTAGMIMRDSQNTSELGECVLGKHIGSPLRLGPGADVALVGIIVQVYTWRGQDPPGNKEGDEDGLARLMELSAALRQDIVRRWPAMTLAEVETAMRKGVCGDYGEYYGLNMVSFVKWLRAYWGSDDRREFVRRKQAGALALQAHKPGRLTKAEVDGMKKEAALRLFEEYKQTGMCDDRGNAVYDWLCDLRIISYGSQQNWSQAVNDSETQLCAKKLALKEYFRILLEAGEELTI